MQNEWERVAPVATAFKQGDVEPVLKQVPSLLKECRDKEVRGCLFAMLAAAHQKRKRWRDGIQCATQALTLDPSLTWVRSTRAVCLMNLKQLRKAESELNRVIEKDAKSDTAYFVRSGCYLMLAVEADPAMKSILLRRSLTDIDTALAFDPHDATYLRHRDLLHSIVGSEVARAEESIDGWQIAGKVAEVAGMFAKGFLG